MTGTAAVIEFGLDTPAYLIDDEHGGLVAGDQAIRDVIDEAVLEVAQLAQANVDTAQGMTWSGRGKTPPTTRSG